MTEPSPPVTIDDITAALEDEIGPIANALHQIAPGRFDDDVGLRPHIEQLAGQLTSTDVGTATRATTQLMALRWPDEPPERCGRADWWTTPVGRLCARNLCHDTNEEQVTQTVAAAMLGVTKGTVSSLVGRGYLDRGAHGGVDRGAVLRRISSNDRAGRI